MPRREIRRTFVKTGLLEVETVEAPSGCPCCLPYTYYEVQIGEESLGDLLLDYASGERMYSDARVEFGGRYRVIVERVEEDEECGVGFAGLYPVPEED